MTEERKNLYRKINDLIDRNRNRLLEYIPNIHEIEDGIIIRTFHDWDAIGEIKYRKISHDNNNNHIYYIPKNSELKIKNIDALITCLSGSIEIIEENGYNSTLLSYNATKIKSNNIYTIKSQSNSYMIINSPVI